MTTHFLTLCLRVRNVGRAEAGPGVRAVDSSEAPGLTGEDPLSGSPRVVLAKFTSRDPLSARFKPLNGGPHLQSAEVDSFIT